LRTTVLDHRLSIVSGKMKKDALSACPAIFINSDLS